MECAVNGSLGSTTTAYSFGVRRESFVETTAGMGAGATMGGMTYQSSGTYYYTGTGSVANVTGTATNQSYSYTIGGSMTAFAMSASAGTTSDTTSTLTTNLTAYGTYGVYGYNGEYTHTGLGLQYLRARYLNVATGTFTSRDTYAGRMQDILSQNRYTYAENNPVGHSDPSGHAVVKSSTRARALQATADSIRNYAQTQRLATITTSERAKSATQGSIKQYVTEQNKKANNTEALIARNQTFYNDLRNLAYKESALRVGAWEYTMYGMATLSSTYGLFPWIDSAAAELEKANCAAYDWCINEVQKALIGKDAGRIVDGSALILEGVGKSYGATWLAIESIKVSTTGVGIIIGIAGLAASTWLVACSMADVTQGAMEVYYGFQGDSLTETKHLMKDSPVYNSNGLAYHISTNVAASLGEVAGGLAAVRPSVAGNSGSKTLLESTPDEIVNMTRKELQDSLPEGWDFQDHNGRIHIRDENGNFRIRIDPPDKKTDYTHIHIMDENKNPLDINGNIVSPKDPLGHIPYNN